MIPDPLCREHSNNDARFPCAIVLPTGNSPSIPPAHLPYGNYGYACEVDIWDVRQRRLRALVDKYGSQSALAKIIGREANYISRLLSRGKNRKMLQETLARDIEKTLDLPALWLDREDGAVAPASTWPFKFPRSQYERLSPRDRDKIEAAILIMMSLCEGSGLDRATKKRAA